MFDIRKIQEKIIFNVVEEFSNKKLAEKIVYSDNEIEETDNEWVQSTMSKLERYFDDTLIEKIRMKCQCGYGIDEKIELLNTIIKSSSNIREFAVNNLAKKAGLYLENDELFLKFDSCPCPMLKDVEKLETNTWCKCTQGYTKTLFEKAFKCKVDVELIKSIKMSDCVCLQKIKISSFNWNKN